MSNRYPQNQANAEGGDSTAELESYRHLIFDLAVEVALLRSRLTGPDREQIEAARDRIRASVARRLPRFDYSPPDGIFPIDEE
jgi:hypothetical protein